MKPLDLAQRPMGAQSHVSTMQAKGRARRFWYSVRMWLKRPLSVYRGMALAISDRSISS